VELSDGRTISVPLEWHPRLVTAHQKNAITGALLAEGREFTGKILMRILALKGLLPVTLRVKASLLLKSGWIRETPSNNSLKPVPGHVAALCGRVKAAFKFSYVCAARIVEVDWAGGPNESLEVGE